MKNNLSFKIFRKHLKDEYTIGILSYSLDDTNYTYLCETLEDTVRPDGVKIYGKTAIPYGIYKLIINLSPRFKKIFPRFLNVKGFDGVLIHSGTDENDTEGCVLVGYNKVKGKLIDSRIAFGKLMDLINSNPQATYNILIYS